MQAKQATFQSPRPEVKLYHYGEEAPYLAFNTAQKTTLQGYSFSTSTGDVRGRFSLTLYPDDESFDKIKVLDIVEIYEGTRLEDGANPKSAEPKKVFTGVVRKKKYSAQIGDSASKRFIISGQSVAGLAADFCLNMDLAARVITNKLASGENISNELTIGLLRSGNKPLKVEAIVKKIWAAFLAESQKYEGQLSNPMAANIIHERMGDDFFDIQDMDFHYPLVNVFNKDANNTFFNILDTILPSPIYEKFAYMDRITEKMRIKIRECPFDPKPWEALRYWDKENKKNTDMFSIPSELVKSFDIEQSDDEVYTVFFSYLSGYPLHEQKALMLAAAADIPRTMPELAVDNKKFSKYGYRPLIVHFIGYGKDPDADDTGTVTRIKNLNQRLMDWYGNLELMYRGTLTLSTNLSKHMPQAGEKISFLGGEFYVEDSDHRWLYGGNPETTLTLSRGGLYESYTEETSIQAEDHTEHIVKGETIKDIAKQYYGSEQEWRTIAEANKWLYDNREIRYIVQKNDTLEKIAAKFFGLENHEWTKLVDWEESGILQVRTGERQPPPALSPYHAPGSAYFNDPAMPREPPDKYANDKSPIIYPGEKLTMPSIIPADGSPVLTDGDILKIPKQEKEKTTAALQVGMKFKELAYWGKTKTGDGRQWKE